MIDIKHFLWDTLGLKAVWGLRPTARTKNKIASQIASQPCPHVDCESHTQCPADETSLQNDNTPVLHVHLASSETDAPEHNAFGPFVRRFGLALDDANGQSKHASGYSEENSRDEKVTSLLAHAWRRGAQEDWTSLKGEAFDHAFEDWFDLLTESIDGVDRSQTPRLKLVKSGATHKGSVNRSKDRPVKIDYLDCQTPNTNVGIERIRLRLTWSDGRCFHGQTKGLMPDGFGVMQWPSGRRYEGHFCRGLPHGEGLLVLPWGDRLKGKFVAGKARFKVLRDG